MNNLRSSAFCVWLSTAANNRTKINMRTFFYFELFHQAQNAEVLSLMQFPSTAFLPADYIISAKVSSCGRSKTRKWKHLDALTAELSCNKFNRIDFIGKFEPYSLENENFRVLSITRSLDMSPTNTLWTATKDWPEQRSGLINREYHTLGSTENYLEYHGVTRYPTCLATTIEFDTLALRHLERDEVHQMLFELLKASLPKELVDNNIVGGGGIEVFDMETRTNVISIAMTDNALKLKTPKSYNLLGEQFGVLQPLMFGKAHICEELAKVFLGRCDIAIIASSKGAQEQGLLHISQEALSNPQCAIQSAPWLVPKFPINKPEASATGESLR